MYYSTVIPWNIKIIVKPVINLTFALIMTVIVKYEEVVIILFVNLKKNKTKIFVVITIFSFVQEILMKSNINLG